MKNFVQPTFALFTTLLLVACASPSMAQTPKVTAPVTKLTAPMTMALARSTFGLPDTKLELISSKNDPDHEICGNGDLAPSWSVENNPNFTLNIQTPPFGDLNRGTIYETAAGSPECFNSFTTKMTPHQITYTMIENQNCPSVYTRLDSDLTVNGDILIYNFHKTWGGPKGHSITIQCVFKSKE